MKRVSLLLCVVSVLGMCKVALALPNLQVYILGATAGDFGSDTDTWLANMSDSPFQLYVVAGYGAKDVGVTNGTLLATVPQGEAGTISGLGSGTFHADLTFLPNTNPALNHYPLSMANAYDFYTFDVGSFSNATTGLYNYNAGDGSITFDSNATGEQKIFQVSITGYDYVHLDAYAKFTDNKGNEDWKANPGSHDSSIVPEPATLALLGLGLLSFVIKRRT
jgi:hypothetical protein